MLRDPRVSPLLLRITFNYLLLLFFLQPISPVIILHSSHFSSLIRKFWFGREMLFRNIAITTNTNFTIYVCTAKCIRFEFRRELPGSCTKLTATFTSTPSDPSGNRVFILALNIRHPFTIRACALGWHTRVVIAKRLRIPNVASLVRVRGLTKWNPENGANCPPRGIGSPIRDQEL